MLGTLGDRLRTDPVEMVLVTADKDLLQLVGPRVRVLSTNARGEPVWFDDAAVTAKWGVTPAQIPDLLALMGDSIDNIPGVPGIGEKTAVKLISQFGSVERLFENLTLVPGKIRETLAANRQKALLSRELATVSTRVPIEQGLEDFRSPGARLGAAALALDRARVRHAAAPASREGNAHAGIRVAAHARRGGRAPAVAGRRSAGPTPSPSTGWAREGRPSRRSAGSASITRPPAPRS